MTKMKSTGAPQPAEQPLILAGARETARRQAGRSVQPLEMDAR